MNGLTKAASDVLAEREAQVTREGWHTDHDDAHTDGELARAAAAYILSGTDVPVLMKLAEADRPIWPWHISYYKPKSRRADLVRAAALLLAEIERLDRADGVRSSHARPSDCTPNTFCTDLNAGRPCACFPAKQPPDGFMEAFYEMAAMLGIEGAQAKSPEQVYREQVKHALEELKRRVANAEEAYLNMRAWAEQNGLDTTARNAGVRVPDGAQQQTPEKS